MKTARAPPGTEILWLLLKNFRPVHGDAKCTHTEEIPQPDGSIDDIIGHAVSPSFLFPPLPLVPPQ